MSSKVPSYSRRVLTFRNLNTLQTKKSLSLNLFKFGCFSLNFVQDNFEYRVKVTSRTKVQDRQLFPVALKYLGRRLTEILCSRHLSFDGPWSLKIQDFLILNFRQKRQFFRNAAKFSSWDNFCFFSCLLVPSRNTWGSDKTNKKSKSYSLRFLSVPEATHVFQKF